MLVGHKKIIEDLKHLAKTNELSHGYIFFGSSMVGKRSAAMAFAKFLEKRVFDEVGANEILQDTKLIDPAYMKHMNPGKKDSIGIDAVREVKSFLGQRPNISARRTLIIDDAELLTAEAQNAILKIAEEPPPSALIILITSDIDGLLPTISSRLQKIYFGTVPRQALEEYLVKEKGMAKEAASELADRSFGKPGLAVRLAEDENLALVLKSAEELLKGNALRRRDIIKKILDDEGFNFDYFLDALVLASIACGLKTKEEITRWHKLMALRQNAANFNLNPRLQLENLFV